MEPATSRDLIAWHLAAAGDLARIEKLNALQEPARRIVTVLKNRSAELAREAIEMRELEAISDQEVDELWGAF